MEEVSVFDIKQWDKITYQTDIFILPEEKDSYEGPKTKMVKCIVQKISKSVHKDSDGETEGLPIFTVSSGGQFKWQINPGNPYKNYKFYKT